MRPLKILVVTQYFWPEQFKINDLCQALTERGHEVVVYTGLPNYPEGRFFKGFGYKGPYHQEWGNIRIIRSPLIPRGQKRGWQLILNYFSYFVFASILAPFLIRGKFDRILVHEPSPITVAIPAIVLKFLKKAPVYLWVMDLWPESLEATGVVKNKKALSLVAALVKWIYRHTDTILVTSKGFIKSIRALGVPQEKIIYWPQWAEPFFQNSVDSKSFEDKNFPSEGFILIFAGNIGTSQDFPTLIKAAEILKNESHIQVVVLGDGLMREWAVNEAHRLQIKNIHFLGQKPSQSMPYFFSKADVLLVSLIDAPLFSITVPAKIQTYLASGKPVLAALNGEGASLIDEWKAGRSCPASNPEVLAQTIKEMSEMSSQVLMEMGKNALKCYHQEFEREKLITALEHQFELPLPIP